MNYTSLFYWLTVADSFKSALDTFSNLFTWLFVLSGIAYVILIMVRSGQIVESETKNEEEDKIDPAIRGITSAIKYIKGIFYTSLVSSIILWMAWTLVPTKKDAILIVAGGSTLNFLTTDSSASKIPSELSNFLVTEIKNLANDAKVELNIKDEKNKILEQAKDMTANELLEKMKVDSNFKKLILE